MYQVYEDPDVFEDHRATTGLPKRLEGLLEWEEHESRRGFEKDGCQRGGGGEELFEKRTANKLPSLLVIQDSAKRQER